MTARGRVAAAIREWLHRVRGIGAPVRDDRDLELELRLHLEMAADEARRRGESPNLAPRTAAIRAGGVAQAMDALRDQRGLPWLDDLVRDVRHACRFLRRSPAFAVVAEVCTMTALEGGLPCFVQPVAARQRSGSPKTAKTRGYIRMGPFLKQFITFSGPLLCPIILRTHLTATHYLCVES